MSSLERALGLPGAVVTGLGSILGTGVFVSLAIAAGETTRWLWLAVLAAGLLATFNGLSSAQLAAAHPVSGGTYEYGTVFVHPVAGLGAGWLFLVAKSASAATAALGASAYLLHALGADPGLRVPLALVMAGALVVVVLRGIRRTAIVNAVVVGATVLGLAIYIGAGATQPAGWAGIVELTPAPLTSFLAATALVFVAFTGYGRIATLGEEVRDPAVTIPRAVIVTLAVSAVLYAGVAAVSTLTVDGIFFAQTVDGDAAPLESMARGWGAPGVASIVSVAAIAAMVGVLLNLIVGLSRVVLAMARRSHLPPALAHVEEGSPNRAVLVVGALVLLLVLIGDVRTTWGLSAVTVLLYYAITNLSALRLPAGQRRFWRWLPWAGLMACVGLAFFVDPLSWMAGAGIVTMGTAVSIVSRRMSGSP